MNNEHVQVNNEHVQVNNEHVQVNNEHVQIEGMAFYDNRKYFLFSPDDPKPGVVTTFRSRGIVQQMSDGTFDVQVKDYPRAQSKLIKKFAHGRASETKDGGIQIFLKVFLHENENIAQVMRAESRLAVKAVEDYLLRGAGRSSDSFI